MRYVLFFTINDYETGKVSIMGEEYDDFEEMMYNFTLLSASKRHVMVIEPNTKKVICEFHSEGHITINRALLDGAIYSDDAD